MVAGGRYHQAAVAAGASSLKLYVPRLATGEVSLVYRPMQKLQLQQGATEVHGDPCPAGQGPLSEWYGIARVRTARMPGFEPPVDLWWRNSLPPTQTSAVPVGGAHYHRTAADPVRLAEISNYVVRCPQTCPHPGTQIMNETFGISELFCSENLSSDKMIGIPDQVPNSLETVQLQIDHENYDTQYDKNYDHNGEDNVGILVAEAINSPTTQSKVGCSRIFGEHLPRTQPVLEKDSDFDVVDQPIDAVDDDSDSDDGNNGVFRDTEIFTEVRRRGSTTSRSTSSRPSSTGSWTPPTPIVPMEFTPILPIPTATETLSRF